MSKPIPLTVKLEHIKEQHVQFLGTALWNLFKSPYDTEIENQIEIDRLVKFYIRSAVQATDLAVTNDERVRLDAKAKAKSDNVQRMFHRPGRFGHG